MRDLIYEYLILLFLISAGAVLGFIVGRRNIYVDGMWIGKGFMVFNNSGKVLDINGILIQDGEFRKIMNGELPCSK